MSKLICVAAVALFAMPAVVSAQTAPAAPATPAQTATPTSPAMPAATATPAAGAGLTVGATVYDPQGNPAGTIDSITGTTVVLSTGTNKVGVASTSFGTSPRGPTIGSTKVALDAAATQSQASAAQQMTELLKPGTPVHGLSGTIVVGSVKEADAQFVTVTTPKGDVRLPVSGFAVRSGGLVIGLSAADFDKAVTGANAK